jgi:hypothetical protein
MAIKEHLFKIIFFQRDNVYEIYARQVSESDMYGFIVVEELVFGERSSVLVDPSEEKVKHEFAEVTRTYIPMHAILRIDEVEKEGVATIVRGGTNTNNVSQFPGMTNNKISSTPQE